MMPTIVALPSFNSLCSGAVANNHHQPFETLRKRSMIRGVCFFSHSTTYARLVWLLFFTVCGHDNCFWCCHRSMDMRGQSHCPLCRYPYRYFPAICQMLDIFLKKMYPVSYERRKTQTLDDEQQNSFGFTQDIDCSEELDVAQPSNSSSENNLSINHFIQENKSIDGNCKEVTVADMLCSSCKQLLFRPVALNCGHVYCEACIIVPEDKVITCEICQCNHPSGFPKVLKEIDCFLEEQFSSEYALRKTNTQLHKNQLQIGNLLTSSSTDKIQDFKLPAISNNRREFSSMVDSSWHKVSIEVGCDRCGLCPIIGDRYQCKDCKEKSGYDLCGDCHNTSSKLPRRFTQKHIQEHRMELVKAAMSRDVIYILLSNQLAVVSAASRSQSNPNQRLESPSSSLNHNDDDDDDDGNGNGEW